MKIESQPLAPVIVTTYVPWHKFEIELTVSALFQMYVYGGIPPVTSTEVIPSQELLHEIGVIVSSITYPQFCAIALNPKRNDNNVTLKAKIFNYYSLTNIEIAQRNSRINKFVFFQKKQPKQVQLMHFLH